MYTTLFFLIVIIIVADFCLDSYIDAKNRSFASHAVPEVLKGIYDDDKYQKQQRYFIANNKISSISKAFSLLVILLMLFFGGFGWIDNICHNIVGNEDGNWSQILICLCFFAIIMVANELLDIPFSFYSRFHIEEKFGFNKSTKKLFFTDEIKEILMGLVIGGLLIGTLTFIYLKTREYFGVLAWIVVSLFSIFMMAFYSTLIVPLFNKQTPLEKGELRDAIEGFCKKVGFKLDDLYVMDSSKRTTKANAYFSGLGSKKRIVLYDTLISTLSTDEIVAVLSHEIGHYKHKHTLKMLIFNILYLGVLFLILSLFLNYGDAINIPETLGSDHTNSFWLDLIVFSILFTPLSEIFGLIVNAISRKNEYEADAFAKNHGMGQYLINALKKLSTSSLSNLTPHPYYVFFHYNHPTLLQRIEAINQ